MEPQIHYLQVLSEGSQTGSPVQIVLNAEGISNLDKEAIAGRLLRRTAFVSPAPAGSNCDYELHFWFGGAEIDFSSQALIGFGWLMSHLQLLTRDNIRIFTKKRLVEALITKTTNREDTKDGTWVEISQPGCKVMDSVEKGSIETILFTLGIEHEDLEPGLKIQNAGVSGKIKTLVPIKSVDLLHSLDPNENHVRSICAKIGSTGLYLFAIVDQKLQQYEAKEFTRNPRYFKDDVTSDAASALAFGLLVNEFVHRPDRAVMVKQTRANGSLSEVGVRFRAWGDDVVGFWIGGTAEFESKPQPETGVRREVAGEAEVGQA
jgi:PhzF family phenazine biosynthesis protein